MSHKTSRANISILVYTIASIIPIGRVTTYSSIARVLGVSPRVVGFVLSGNVNPIIVPCHRVVRSDMRVGGYSFGGELVKARLLSLEGVTLYERDGNFYVDKSFFIDVACLLGFCNGKP